MSNDFDDEFDDDFEDEEEGGPAGETFEEMLRRLAASGNLTTRHVSDDGEEGESREISVEEFNAQMSGVSQIKNDYDENKDDEDDESSSQQFSIGFGLGSDGSVTRLEDDGSGGLSFSFTLDEDGIEVPEFRCPRCKIKNCEELDLGSDTYKCNACGFEFVPEIYKTLETASAYVERAEQNWLEGKYTRVIKDSTAALNLDPNIRKAYLQRGKALVEKEKMEQAENDFSEAIRISPDYDVAYFERGKTRMYLQKFDDAIADFTKSIDFDPDFAETFRLRAVGYLQQERYDEAIKDLSEALKRDPGEAQAWFERGYNYNLLGEHEKAVQDYSEALRRDSGHRDSYARRAESYEKLERYQDAITDYKNFLRTIGKGTTADEINERINALQLMLNPNVKLVDSPEAEEDSNLIFQRGLERFESEDYEGCIADLDQAILLAPENAEFYLARFKVKAKLNDFPGASEDLTKAFLLDPSNEMVKELFNKFTAGEDKQSQVNKLMMSAMEKINSGDLYGCLADLKQAEKLDPDSQWVKDILSEFPASLLNGESDLVEDSDISEEDKERERVNQFANSGLDKFKGEDYEGCIDDLSQAIDLNPEDGVWILYKLRGDAKFRLGQNEAALLDYSEVIRLEPNNSMGYLARSLIHLQNESYDQAIADFDSVLDRHLELDEDDKFASYIRRGYAKLHMDLFTEAILDLSQAIMLRPEDPDAYYYRAEAYKELHEYKSAISDYQFFVRLTDDEDDKAKALGFIQEMELSLNSESSKQSPTPKSAKGEPNSDIPTEKKTSPDTPKPPLTITETWMQMGKAALEKGLYPDAVLNFEKVVKKEPHNWEATIYFMRAIGGQTDFENEAWEIFFENINQIKNFILNHLTGNERKAALMLIAESVHWYTDLYMNLVKEGRDKRLYDLENQADGNTLIGIFNLFCGGIGRLEDSLTFLNSMGDKELQTIKHAINKSKINWITTLCEPVKARMRPWEDGIAYVGIPDDVRFKYITKYESILDEIVKVEPEYKPAKLIDRLKAPSSRQEALNRPAELAKKQISIDKAREIRIAEYERQEYWETHPEEYAAYLDEEKRKKEEERARALAEEQRRAEERKARALAEQKRKQELFEERKQKLQKEIDEHNLKLDELKREADREIDRLRKERETLGFLAMGKKKEIDQKILSLEKQLSDFAAKTDALRKQLKDLKL
jgi:tetratricopeptide (TPR) repeat protein